MTLTAIDAFCGAGGLSRGLMSAGFDVRAAFDNDPVAVATYERNLGDHVRFADAYSLEPEELLEWARLRPGECDLFAGGPPCQGFSLQRRGRRDDERNHLVTRFADIAAAIKPKFVLLENVAALATIRGEEVMNYLNQRLSQAGYTVELRELDAYDFGVAQRRLRAVVIAARVGFAPRWPRPSSRGPRTVAEAWRGLPRPPLDGSPHPAVANHYRESRLSQLNVERIRHVPEGGGREHLPEHLWLACHKNGHRHLDTYGRLAFNAPAVTITARFDSFTRGRFGHPREHRSITLREGARLQGFPDDFAFAGNREDGARLIGNAVPPPFARAIGLAVRRALSARGRDSERYLIAS